MLKPPRYRSKGWIGGGPSPKWVAYWMALLWAAAGGYAVIRPWLFATFPPLFEHISGFGLALSAVASLSGIAIAGVVVVGTMRLYGLLATQRASSASTDTTVQSSQETESS